MSTPTRTSRRWATRILSSPIPQRSTIRKALNSLWLLVAFCALALAGYQVGTGQWHATPVLSGSMRPGMQPGDVVITQRVPISDLHVRDVVVFHPPNEGNRQTVHRIVKLTMKGATTSITTWGDANSIADPVVSSLSGTTAYRMVRVVPLLGYPAVWLQSGGRGMLAIALGVILLIAAAVIVLRPDKPTEPPGSVDPTRESGHTTDSNTEPLDRNTDPTDSAADPLEPAVR